MRHLLTVLALALVAAAFLVSGCSRIAIDNTGGTGGGGGAGGGGGTGGSGPTSPTPTPQPGGSSGPRAPDPAAGAILAVPANGPGIEASYAAANANALLNLSCPTTNPSGGWTYLDGLVKALRATDTRWGYLSKGDNFTVAQDIVAYHATAGPDVPGAVGVYIIDVINNVCGAVPGAQWFVSSYSPSGVWATRGAF